MDTWSTSVPGRFCMVFLVLHALGNWTLHEPLVSGTSSSLFGVGAMLGSHCGYMFRFIQGGLWKNLYDFLHEGVDSGS